MTSPDDHPHAIPAEVKAFLTHYIMAVDLLEILLLTHRYTERTWTASEIAVALYLNEESTAERLEALAQHALLVRIDGQPLGYRYHPAIEAHDQTIRTLAQLYRDRRTTIISLIYSKPVDRVRTFADAFKFRNQEE